MVHIIYRKDFIYGTAPVATKRLEVRIFTCRISAGSPSPADGYMDSTLDLNEFLIRCPAATFFMRVSGDSMTGAGIFAGDILIVDRAEEAKNNSIIIAGLNGELMVRRLIVTEAKSAICLFPENSVYEAVHITGETHFQVWGVVIHVIHSFSNSGRF